MPVQLLSSNLPRSLKQLEKILLKNRGLSNGKSFFRPNHPSALTVDETGLSSTALQKVSARLLAAREALETVVIFGDYDADGVCATAILWEALHELGIRAQPFIPDRFTHGYGLTVAAIEAVTAASKPDVIITVDNGIVAYEALALARAMGIFTIVTDHHQPDIKPVPADLILHSVKLSGAGVAWVLANYLVPAAAKNSLALAGLATIADQVPLLGANRSMAWHGLRALQTTSRVGLLELFKVAGVDQTKITEKTVGFNIAPRINAMGRLSSALDALRLICTTSQVRAQKLAQLLQDTNVERQQLTQDLLALAKLQAEEQLDAAILVIHSTSFHEGIIGLIAGQLVEAYGKPAVVIAMGETVGKGSARSTSVVNMVALLRSVREHLLELGGHPMAAGFNIQKEKLDVFRQAAQASMTKLVLEQPAPAMIAVECVLPHELVTLETAEYLEKYAPFGMQNHQPVFQITDATCLSSKLVGKQGSHRKYAFRLGDLVVDGMTWYNSESLAEPLAKNLSLIASLGIEEWKQRSLLLNIKMMEQGQ